VVGYRIEPIQSPSREDNGKYSLDGESILSERDLRGNHGNFDVIGGGGGDSKADTPPMFNFIFNHISFFEISGQ